MIAVREFTNGADVLAHAAEIRRKFYGSRQVTPARVLPAPEKAADILVVAQETRRECDEFRQLRKPAPSSEVVALSDVQHLAGEVADLRALVIELRSEVAALREEIGTFQEIEAGAPRTVSMAFIRALVLTEFDVARRDIDSQRRSQDFSRPRFALMWLLKEYTSASYPVIGRFIGNRDHSTVMSGCKQCDILMARHAAFRAKVEAIQARIHAELAQ